MFGEVKVFCCDEPNPTPHDTLTKPSHSSLSLTSFRACGPLFPSLVLTFVMHVVIQI